MSTHGLLGAAALEGPPRIRDLAMPAYIRTQVRQSIMNDHRSRLEELLDQRGIRSLVLKGTNAGRWYANPAIRTSTDVDLLVPAEDVVRRWMQSHRMRRSQTSRHKVLRLTNVTS